MRALGWLLLAIFGGIVVYLVSRKPQSTGTQHTASLAPGKPVAPTTNNITGTVAGTAASGATIAKSLSSLIGDFFPPSSVTLGDSISQDATAASIGTAAGSTNIGDFPGVSNSDPSLSISSIYDTGFGIAPTLAPPDMSIADAVDASIVNDISLYS